MSIFLLFLFTSKNIGKNISINLKITLAILNDICYYIDKDRYRYRYRFGDKYTDNNIIVTLELN